MKWIAILAPIGSLGINGQYIAETFNLTFAGEVPLFDSSGEIIGKVTEASIVSGYITASGIANPGISILGKIPTFDLHPSISSWNADYTVLTFTSGTIQSVRSGFSACWEDSMIGFTELP